jgi:hypothetical protein
VQSTGVPGSDVLSNRVAVLLKHTFQQADRRLRLTNDPTIPISPFAELLSRSPITLSGRTVTVGSAIDAGTCGQHRGNRRPTLLQRFPQRGVTSEQKSLTFFGGHRTSTQLVILGPQCSQLALVR